VIEVANGNVTSYPQSSGGAHRRGVGDEQRVRRYQVDPVRVVEVSRPPSGGAGVPVLPHDAVGGGVDHADAVVEVVVEQDVAILEAGLRGA